MRQAISLWLAAAAVVSFALPPIDAEAKRVGGGRTVGSKPTQTTKTKKPGEEETKTSTRTTSITPRISTSSSSSRPSAVPAAAAGAAVGAAAAGAASAAADPEANRLTEEAEKRRAAELAALQKRFEDEAKLRKMDEEMKKKDADAAAAAQERKREQQEAQKRAALEREKEAKRLQKERDAQCVIKPVMSDDDIARCRR